MLDILAPLLMRGDMFALSEYMTGSVASIFFALSIDGRTGWFHGYCDLSDRGSPDRMKAAIIDRETRPVRVMTREERLEHIWSSTHDDYRGYAGERWPAAMRRERTVLVYGDGRGTVLNLPPHPPDDEVPAPHPV